ncbi:hypothetical protein NIIDMKKI_74000 [Mycobacterium kansasii]|uniref:Uncharacterized protein n=1 Tax=Mycobacterium kansasii TaxID=1768 RepID=A0A7G1IPD4_MYCKA|nr:hypothetical protein NIIDMKKI_74000 [Mycobacterium kansasii]
MPGDGSNLLRHGRRKISPYPFTAGSLVIEHPAGTISVEVIGGGRADGISAVLRSTARKLFDGTVFADLDKMAA